MISTEEDLIKYCKQRDATAQKLLYQQYVGDVLKQCLRYINNRTDIEDIAQHTFVKVFAKIDQFSFLGTGSLKAWIHRIATNECLMHLRKNSNFQINLVEDESWFEEQQENQAVPWALSKYQLSHIYECIRKLPDGYRTVLNLYVFEEMTHEAISKELDISINTSKSQLSRARQLLKKLLNS